EHVLLVSMHHIISDGWSVAIMVREFTQLYEAYRVDEPSPLAELEVQYADFALWQRQWLQGDELGRQLSYWREQLEGLEALELPTDHPRPAQPSYRGDSLDLLLPADLTASLEQFSRKQSVTLFMTLLAAFHLLLARYSRQADFAIGTPVAARDLEQTRSLIGFFVNTLVLRTRLHPELRVSQWLAQVRSTCLAAYSHQDVPFDRLVEALQPQRDLSRNLLFQVLLALHQPLPEQMAIGTLTARPLQLARHWSAFDLSLALTPRGACLEARLDYSTDLYE